jgi:SARP family transcriptional regulator, regulator of embCAB operon
MLQFRVLGPIEVAAGSHTEHFKGRLQRSLLLVLLVNRGNLVQTESLIGEIWHGKHPGHVVNALQAHISRLRRRLQTLEGDSGPPRLLTDAVGYQLLVEDEELDAAVFERGVERIRAERTGDRAARALELRALLDLWCGPVFGGAVAGPLVQSVALRYEELRVSAFELLFDHELAMGQYHQIIPELYQLTAEHRFKERFHQQLIIALYRAGRQCDALEVYQCLRRDLAEDLGLVPSPAMRSFENAVLGHDRSLWAGQQPGLV